MWVRGLKLSLILTHLKKLRVAPHVGAWIETFEKKKRLNPGRSHPMWVRGLKLMQYFLKRV